jgi:hypothetical protein
MVDGYRRCAKFSLQDLLLATGTFSAETVNVAQQLNFSGSIVITVN